MDDLTMSLPSIITRLAIESYHQPKLVRASSYQWSYSSVYRATQLLLALPEAGDRNLTPASHCFCMNCGNVIPLTGLYTQRIFQKACYRCEDELSVAERGAILSMGHGHLQGWNALEAILVLQPDLLASYMHYLQNLWLTGFNPFETIIESYKERLANHE